MTDTALSTGNVLASRYRLERALGEGGMGRVFAAVDQQLGRRVAIKVIREDLDDQAARDRFLREARAAAALSHANACQLFEVAEHDGTPFLVLELLDGEPLSARLQRGPMTLDEAASVILPLMDALIAFHDAGLIHRDLKPSNVFLTSQGVKLLDFGLARRTQRADAVTAPSLTAPGGITGTLRYMAPEQLTGDPVDARTDVFALGVMLYEMLTGRIPFGGDGTNVDWLNAVLTEEPPHLEDPALQAVDSIIARSLQRRPDDRYTSVEELANDLRAATSSDTPANASAATSARAASTDAVKETAISEGRKASAANRAVVLPFRLLQDDPEVMPLQNGVPEMLTALLSGKGPWEFVSNRVAQPFADETDLIAVGRSLRVERLLTGSVLRAGDEVQVTVQLIDAADGGVQWSQTKRHRRDSVLAMQDEICRQIVDELPLTRESAGAAAN